MEGFGRSFGIRTGIDVGLLRRTSEPGNEQVDHRPRDEPKHVTWVRGADLGEVAQVAQEPSEVEALHHGRLHEPEATTARRATNMVARLHGDSSAWGATQSNELESLGSVTQPGDCDRGHILTASPRSPTGIRGPIETCIPFTRK